MYLVILLNHCYLTSHKGKVHPDLFVGPGVLFLYEKSNNNDLVE